GANGGGHGLAVLALLGIATTARADISAGYAGQLTIPSLGQTVDAAAALTEVTGLVSGTVVFALADPALAAAFVVQGHVAAAGVRLSGASPAGARVVVRGAVRRGVLQGVARIRTATARTKGKLTLTVNTASSDGSACDAVFTQNAQFFTKQVLGNVL